MSKKHEGYVTACERCGGKHCPDCDSSCPSCCLHEDCIAVKERDAALEALEDLERQRNQEFDRAEDAECRLADAQMALEEARAAFNTACDLRLQAGKERDEAQGKLDAVTEALRPYKCQSCREQGTPDTTLDGQPAHYIAGGMGRVVCFFDEYIDAILRGSKEEG